MIVNKLDRFKEYQFYFEEGEFVLTPCFHSKKVFFQVGQDTDKGEDFYFGVKLGEDDVRELISTLQVLIHKATKGERR